MKNKPLSLALEMFSGQKLKSIKSSSTAFQMLKFNRSSTAENKTTQNEIVPQVVQNKTNKHLNSRGSYTQADNAAFLSTMRNDVMYNCVEKLFTVATMYDCVFQIYKNQIRLTIQPKQLYLFSEIQTNLELFETIPVIHLVLYTSAKSNELKETALMWTSIFTKPF
jgi:hypothetical protein